MEKNNSENNFQTFMEGVILGDKMAFDDIAREYYRKNHTNEEQIRNEIARDYYSRNDNSSLILENKINLLIGAVAKISNINIEQISNYDKLSLELYRNPEIISNIKHPNNDLLTIAFNEVARPPYHLLKNYPKFYKHLSNVNIMYLINMPDEFITLDLVKVFATTSISSINNEKFNKFIDYDLLKYIIDYLYAGESYRTLCSINIRDLLISVNIDEEVLRKTNDYFNKIIENAFLRTIRVNSIIYNMNYSAEIVKNPEFIFTIDDPDYMSIYYVFIKLKLFEDKIKNYPNINRKFNEINDKLNNVNGNNRNFLN